MELKLSHLRSLQEVLRQGNYTRAAAVRHLTQPAVSLHIRELEAQIGQALTAKVGRRVLPTPAATLLLQHAARIFDELERAKHELQQLQSRVSGPVRLGTGATASIYLLPPALRELRTRFTDLELVVTTGNTGEIVQAVTDNTLDFGVVTLPVSQRALRVVPLFSDPLVAIAPPDHPRPAGRLSPAGLARQPLILFERGGNIRRVIDAWFRRAHVTPRTIMEVGSAEATKRLVGAGLGMSLISRIAVTKEIDAGELLELPIKPPLVRRLAIIHRKDRPITGALDAALAVVGKHLRACQLRAGRQR